MKKTLFLLGGLFLMLAASSLQLNAQDADVSKNMTISEIVSAIEAAANASGINNPDHIEPGQEIVFMYENGSQVSHDVVRGDILWNIVQTISESSTSPIVSVETGEVGITKNATGTIILSSTPVPTDPRFPWWTLLLALPLLLLFIAPIRRRRKENSVRSLNDTEPYWSGERQGEELSNEESVFSYAASRDFFRRSPDHVERVYVQGKPVVQTGGRERLISAVDRHNIQAWRAVWKRGLLPHKEEIYIGICANVIDDDVNRLVGGNYYYTTSPIEVADHTVNEVGIAIPVEVEVMEEVQEEDQMEIPISFEKDNMIHLINHPAFYSVSDPLKALILADFLNGSEMPEGMELVVYKNGSPLQLNIPTQPQQPLLNGKQSVVSEEG